MGDKVLKVFPSIGSGLWLDEHALCDHRYVGTGSRTKSLSPVLANSNFANNHRVVI